MSWRWKLGIAVWAGLLIGGGYATAGSIKSWSNEVITASDLNTNFSHIHDVMVGGHGARLVDGDVSASAAIAHSKLAAPQLVPKAWALCTDGVADGNPGVLTEDTGFASCADVAGTGLYSVTFDSARANANYGVFLTPINATGAVCYVTARSTTVISFTCSDLATPSAVDVTAIHVLVMDND